MTIDTIKQSIETGDYDTALNLIKERKNNVIKNQTELDARIDEGNTKNLIIDFYGAVIHDANDFDTWSFRKNSNIIYKGYNTKVFSCPENVNSIELRNCNHCIVTSEGKYATAKNCQHCTLKVKGNLAFLDDCIFSSVFISDYKSTYAFSDMYKDCKDCFIQMKNVEQRRIWPLFKNCRRTITSMENSKLTFANCIGDVMGEFYMTRLVKSSIIYE